MAEPPATKKMKLWGQTGSLPFCRQTEVVMDNGKILKSFNTWPEVEKNL